MRQMFSNLLSSVGQIIKYGCVVHCTFEYIGDLVICSGPSMEPTIFSDDILLTEHVSPVKGWITKGDIVIAKCPTNPNQQICKRVIGLPGDKVRTGIAQSKVVPIGHVWLEGDNLNNSSDSRTYGPVPQGLIRSKAVLRIWPLREVGLLKER